MVLSVLFAAGFLFKLFEHVGGVTVASCRQPAELIEVARLAGCFDQLVRRVPAARISQSPEFVQVPPLGGTLNQFIDGVGLAAGRPLPQGLKLRIGCLHAPTMGFRVPHVQSRRTPIRQKASVQEDVDPLAVVGMDEDQEQHEVEQQVDADDVGQRLRNREEPRLEQGKREDEKRRPGVESQLPQE